MRSRVRQLIVHLYVRYAIVALLAIALTVFLVGSLAR
jgi:hypothetical protein